MPILLQGRAELNSTFHNVAIMSTQTTQPPTSSIIELWATLNLPPNCARPDLDTWGWIPRSYIGQNDDDDPRTTAPSGTPAPTTVRAHKKHTRDKDPDHLPVPRFTDRYGDSGRKFNNDEAITIMKGHVGLWTSSRPRNLHSPVITHAILRAQPYQILGFPWHWCPTAPAPETLSPEIRLLLEGLQAVSHFLLLSDLRS
jgi:hypothetical protein